MISILKKDECCGCGACAEICPKNCIDLVVDEEGFWYPKININQCVNCNACEKACPSINVTGNTDEIREYNIVLC